MKISQLSHVIGISSHTIRYYEKIGLLDHPQKDLSGHRFYNSKSVKIANWVTCLKKSGMSLEKIKEYSSAYKNNEENKITELLEVHLSKLKIQQENIDHNISVTENKLKKLKNNLT